MCTGKLSAELSWQQQHSTSTRLFSPAKCIYILERN